MNTTAIIVTYGNRYSYLKQVVDLLLSFNLHGIVIVNNNSVKESHDALVELSANNRVIKLVNLGKNTGSAYAIKCGIETVLDDTESDFIWLLDDDNLPYPDAYDTLIRNMGEELRKYKNHQIIISLLRGNRRNYINAVKKSMPYSIIGKKNIFRSFHITDLFPSKTAADESIIKGDVSALPYGGMFFHKDVIKETGFPDQRFYLYCDDFDFCCRHLANGGRIILSLESGIDDIEQSWNIKGSAIKNIARGEDLFKIYYSVRNRVFLEKKYLVTSWIVYIFNMVFYSALVTLIALSGLKFNNIKTYYTALYHGLTGKMGCNEKYSI